MDNPQNNAEKKRLQYWKSMNQYNNDPAFSEKKKNEFLENVTQEFNIDDMPQFSRRKFMALLGASAAFVSTACTDYPDKGKVVPYNKMPEEVNLGEANYYASTYDDGSGILIKTREGRPIKVDGNPDHPVNQDKTTNHVQASILNLYDPERIRQPLMKREGEVKEGMSKYKKVDWNKIDGEMITILNRAKSAGKEIAIVSKSINSPSFQKMLDDFKAKYPSTKVYTYELFNRKNRLAAWEKCYGNTNFPIIKWNKAKTILALEADFIGNDRNSTENIRKFVKTRNTEDPGNFSRLYCAEGSMTQTGANADYRLRLTPAEQYPFVMFLLSEVKRRLNPPQLAEMNFAGYDLKEFAEKNELKLKVVQHLIDELIANKGRSIVYAGDTLPENVHIAVNLLNEVLGNTRLYNKKENDRQPQLSGKDDIRKLVNNMKNGGVEAVIHLDSNPVYHLPDDSGYEAELKQVPEVISMTELHNESSAYAKFILPINHTYESWGDANIRSGIYSLRQPVIAPLYNTRQKEAILLRWLGGSPDKSADMQYHDFVKNFWQNEVYPKSKAAAGFEQFWKKALHDGAAKIDEKVEDKYEFNKEALISLKNYPNKEGFAVILQPSYAVGDGKYANNGWLLEVPHPVTKVVWDNNAAISPKTAKSLGVDIGDMIEVTVGNRKLKLPAMIQPGMAEKTISVELGYGRKNSGIVANDVGFNANKLMSMSGGLSDWIFTGAAVKATGEKYEIVSTQEHHPLDDEFTKDKHKERDIIQEGTLEEYKEHPHFLHENGHEPISITEDVEYPGVKWGMAIEMNKCIGCNQCISACNVENNIPVVGKEHASVGREMQWIRVDRYYSGEPEEPEVSMQTILCQHCDNAPCENVCPVSATTHSPDGLNQMVYNRCVGTRYCSNNCPYKVRRFNFMDYRKEFRDGVYASDSLNVMQNPEVTVRSRGVMEKCTFCVQRIYEEKQNATNEGRGIKGSNVTTACQEACPADAIVFGDINDPESKVSKLRKHNLGYKVLEFTNVRPNVTYIAKLRNKFSEES